MAVDRILRVIIAGDAAGAIAAMEDFDRSMERAHAEADEHGGGIASAFAGAAQKVAIASVGVAVTAGIIADELYKMGAPYEQLLNQIQAFTHASTAQMSELSSYLYQISPQLATYGLTSEDAADAIAKLTKAGLSLSDAQTAVLPVLALSKAGTIDVGDAANFAAEAMNVWGLKASDMTMVANALTGAAHSSTATVQDMGNSLSFSAAAAAHAGLSFQQTAAFLAEVANAGVSGSKAGTALKDILVNLEAPTSAASAAMKSLGINVWDSQGKMVDFGTLLGELHDKLGGLSEQQQSIYVKDIFGKIPMESALTIIKGGLPAYQKYLNLVSQTGEAAEIAGAKSVGLSGAIARTGAQFESMGQALYLKLAPTFTKIVNGAADMLPKLGALASKGIGILSKAFNSGTGQGIGKSIEQSVKGALPVLESLAGSIKSVFESAKSQGVFSALGGALKSLAGLVTGTILPAFRQVAVFFSKSIAPTIVGVYKTEILPAIKSFAEFLSGTLVPKVKSVLTALKPLAAWAESFVAGKLVPLFKWAVVQLKPVFKEIGGVVSSLLDFLIPFIKFLTPVIEWLVNILSGPAIGAVKGFFNGLVRVISGALEILKGILDFLTGIFTGNWSKVWEGVKEIFSGAFNAIIGLVKVLIFGKMIQLFLAGFAAIEDLFTGGGEALLDFFKSFGTKLVNFAKSDMSSMVSQITEGWTWAKGVFSDAINWIKTFLSSGWKQLLSDISSFFQSANLYAKTMMAKFYDAIWNGWLEVTQAVTKYGGQFLDWFKDLPGKIEGYVADAGTWLLQAGKDAITGLIDGVDSMAQSAVNAVKSVGKKLISGFKSVLGINSPSTVMRLFGVNTFEGYNNGAISMVGKVQQTMNKLGKLLPNTAGHVTLQAALAGAGVRVASPAAFGVSGAAALGLSGASASGTGTILAPVTVNVAGSVTAEKDLAKAIAVPVRDHIRQVSRRNGGRTGLGLT